MGIALSFVPKCIPSWRGGGLCPGGLLLSLWEFATGVGSLWRIYQGNSVIRWTFWELPWVMYRQIHLKWVWNETISDNALLLVSSNCHLFPPLWTTEKGLPEPLKQMPGPIYLVTVIHSKQCRQLTSLSTCLTLGIIQGEPDQVHMYIFGPHLSLESWKQC